MNYQKAIDIINSRRRAAQTEAAARYDTALEDAGFYAAECALRAAQLKTATDKSKAAQDNLKKTQKARAAALLKLKLTDADFAPRYSCKLCGDCGMIGGSLCNCAKNLAIETSLKNTAALIDNAEFETTGFTVFDPSERPKIQKIYAHMQEYCQKFRTTERRNVLLLGNTGTGKTHLISCICNRLIKRGENVFALTAFELINRALAYHTTFDEKKLSYLAPVLSCDLLVIDDLGTESIFKNVTLEYLYLIINERLIKARHTVITTNLSPDALQARYGARIASRLLDKKHTYVAALGGSDIRKLL